MKKKVFVIDDNGEVLHLLEIGLRHKFETFSFLSAEEALIQLPRVKPDLIISDIMLPGMDGYEFCSHLREHEDWRTLPFIFLSRKKGSNARSTGYKLGAINYLEKPFELSEIIALTESVLYRDELMRPEELAMTVIDKRNIKIDPLRNTCTYKNNPIKLTNSEMLLLSKLLRNFGIVCSRLSLLENIESNASDDRILDNYIKSLREKLKLTDLRIFTIYGRGYKMENVSS